MSKINSLLKDANLYSIEYVGYLILKFTISDKSEFYTEFQDIAIEFISGYEIEKANINNSTIANEIFELFGTSICYSEIKNNHLILTIENDFKIITKIDEDELTDRNWMIKVLDNNDSFILNDANELIASSDMKNIIDE